MNSNAVHRSTSFGSIAPRTTNARSPARLNFSKMSFGAKDGCSDQITIRAGGKTETHHEILEPINIRLRESGKDGTYNGMAIEAEEGTTLVTFQPAIHGASLGL